MTRRTRWIAGIAATALLLATTAAAPVAAQDTSPSAEPPGGAAPMTAAEFHDAMRRLWEDHVFWTRLFIVSKATLPEDLPDLQATTDRLLANQVDIGDAIKPFYGDEAGNQLSSLLTDHITTAAELVTAAKAADSAAVDAASQAWYANADQIAEFLTGANPDNWPIEMTRAMMKDHLDLTLQEATDQIQGNYEEAVATFDIVSNQILAMADMLSDGIIAQFPDRFAS
jgi:hypothetical protein